ncbi:LapA family protein [Aestuariibius sp. HNIBRBA575]|uniref:LapA family protein n=1 Tax=Aestuariibius sp. HNIBRBA575 TaxID=3233343 RepID=UPI0034A4E47F
MRYIRYGFWAIVAICLIAVGLANRGLVTLRAMPEFLADLLGMSPVIELPLYVVIAASVGVGLLVGFMWEWLREHRFRAEAKSQTRAAKGLRREVDRLKAEKHEGKDEVLALLEQSS